MRSSVSAGFNPTKASSETIIKLGFGVHGKTLQPHKGLV
jgi:hypothetical protein